MRRRKPFSKSGGPDIEGMAPRMSGLPGGSIGLPSSHYPGPVRSPVHLNHRSPTYDVGWKSQGKHVLVTGGTGTIGGALVRRILQQNPASLTVFSRDETKQFYMRQDLPQVRFLIGDVRDRERLEEAFEGVNVVYHAAAMKHVPACDENPQEATKTNVLGTWNVLRAAQDAGVQRVIAISTDKAVYPTNAMGVSKMLMEKMVTYASSHATRTVCVRFGNVLGSRGSVVPLFVQQIASGRPLTLTDPSMTRFMMRMEDAVNLVLQTAEKVQGGETFVLRMPAVTLKTLADAVIQVAAPRLGRRPKDVSLRIIGARPGEKKHESIMSEEEAKRALQTEEMYIIPPPHVRNAYPRTRPANVRWPSSKEAPHLSPKEIRLMLERAEIWKWGVSRPVA